MSPGFLFTSLAALAWAISIIITRLVLAHGLTTAATLAFWVTLISSPYWFYLLYKNRSRFHNAQPQDYLFILFIGLINTIGVILVENLALNNSPAVNFSFLVRTVILFTIVLAAIFLKEALTLKKIILATLILTGSYLLVTQGQALKLTVGDLFTLTEALMLGILSVSQKALVTKFGSAFTVSAAFAFALIPFSLLLFSQGIQPITKLPLPLFLLAILATVGINRFKLEAFRYATASYVTMIFSFTPVFVSLMAIPLLKESLAPIQIIGGLLIILAGIGVEKLKI